MAIVALAAEPVPPSFVEGLQPVYPASELQRGQSAAVLLQLELDSQGTVVAAQVVESAGDAFDAAALTAARSFRFRPATVDGQPMAIAIQYRVVFEPERAAEVSLEGRVLEAGTRQALAGFSVALTQGETTLVTETGEDGTLQVAGLDPGTWTLTAASPGYALDPATVEVASGRVAQITLFPVVDRPWEVEGEEISESVVVVGRRVAPEITERVLSTEEARYLPGTGGDIVRVVQNLPGVARPPLNIGQLIVRGTAPESSKYYIDGAEIPIVFHFGGLSTVLNGDAIAEIAYLPGNYGVRYGRTVGGVVDLRTDGELPERSRGYVSVDLFQATAFVQQKLGERTALTLSGRRSYVDAVLTPVLSGLGSATVQAPRYYDLQLRLHGKTRSGGVLDALFLVSDDRFEVLGEDADETEQVQIGLATTFQKLRLQSREELPGGWRNEASLIAGPEQQSFDLAPNGVAFERPFTVGLREELFRAPGPAPVSLGLRAGVDLQVGEYRYNYDISAFGEPEAARVLRLAPAAYLEPTVRLGRLDVVPGIRVDGLSLGDVFTATTFDPRVATRLDLGTTALKASTGLYSQWPTVRQAIDQPALVAARGWQSSLGLEQQLGPDLSVELTGFTQQLRRLVSGREDAFRFFSGPPPIGPLDTDPYANDGVGTVVGGEALVKLATERTTGWVSATVSRSTRVDRPGDERALFEYDQPLVLTALASHQLPKRWRLGARARFGSGNPFTPVVNRVLDLGSRNFVPVYGQLDSARLPPFWQFDVRVDKDWVYRNWQLTAYLDLQNATNAQNVEVMAWTYDFREEDPITQLPLVPAFGVRAEW
ncbi:MAG: TonB family protein [Myxococcales bacterium]|nr:TonB family protein [Myxococcales bacterium]